VSRLCTEIDERVRSFLERPIEGDWPYLWIDATYVKVREAGRIVSVAVTIAVAVNTDGRREVLGMAIGASEAETFWVEFLRKLKRRGLAGVKLVISDAHDPLERVNGEIKRRTEVVGIFPNEAAITRLVGAILLEQNDEWSVRRARYMTLETIAPLRDDLTLMLPAVAA
jgi:transposase-like protein